MSETSEGVCATRGCPRPPAFKTRSRPTWCTPCLERIFDDAGVRALEHPKKYGEYTRKEFTRRPAWAVDILAPSGDSAGLVIEYDGAYWHTNKSAIDRHKTMDLLRAGYRVARLREHPLESLDIVNDRYFETTVHATAVRPDEVIGTVLAWATRSPKTRAQ